jgi:hypothetical protein
MLAASIITLTALKMDAASTSETSVIFYQSTRRNNPEHNHLHISRLESMKPAIIISPKSVVIYNLH